MSGFFECRAPQAIQVRRTLTLAFGQTNDKRTSRKSSRSSCAIACIRDFAASFLLFGVFVHFVEVGMLDRREHYRRRSSFKRWRVPGARSRWSSPQRAAWSSRASIRTNRSNVRITIFLSPIFSLLFKYWNLYFRFWKKKDPVEGNKKESINKKTVEFTSSVGKTWKRDPQPMEPAYTRIHSVHATVIFASVSLCHILLFFKTFPEWKINCF